MSTDSPLEDKLAGGEVALQLPSALQFETLDSQYYHAEFVETGEGGADLTYHFWPPGDLERFPVEDFAKHLEAGFQKVLPSDANVTAEFTDYEEAALRMREGVGVVPQKDFELEFVLARETYFVRVVDGAKYHLYETFLKSRVFDLIDNEIKGA